ncbi:MAG: tyrosine-type recombinase/integrase [Erysipelotrichaceae bacterium]|nr:tyrosine-type recombinase/integrase [Erysipelotrichaceae bacterium]
MVRRKDKKGRVLKDGESQRKDGTYQYRWTDRYGKRHCVYGKTLEILRDKVEKFKRDSLDGIRRSNASMTVNDLFALWKELKRGVKLSTKSRYQNEYGWYVEETFGKLKLSDITKSEVKRHYIYLLDKKNLSLNSIGSVHSLLCQLFDIAVDDNYMRVNPARNALKELKKDKQYSKPKKRGLTLDEQKVFVNFLNEDKRYKRWKPIFITLLYTGMRVGECTGLTWKDVDFDKREISVNHTLVCFRSSEKKWVKMITEPKTTKGIRTIPMLESVKEALIEEKEMQSLLDIKQDQKINGYSDFVFVNKDGNVRFHNALNKVLRNIVKDCNEIQKQKGNKEDIVLLPHITNHILRHTFATRMCESDINIKVIQDILGHSEIQTTLDIYTDATEHMKKKNMKKLSDYLER